MSEETDARARILIVEDELIIAQNLKFRLEKLGYSVTNITIDAEETRAALRVEVPDLVLMDIALYGGNDGVILAKWIDKNYRIPVIYVTSHTDNSTFERATKSMPYGYLLKPFNPKELYNSIELALQRHKLLMQLSSSSHLLGSVLQSIGDAIVVTDKKKGIMYMNDSAEKLLEQRYDVARKLSVDELLPFQNTNDEQTPAEWNLKKSVGVDEIDFECRLETESRSNFLEVRFSELNNEFRKDIPEGYLIIMRDITRRKNVENIFAKIARAVSGETGEAFFLTLTEQLSETLGMDYCILGEFCDKSKGFCTPTAIYSGDKNQHIALESIKFSGTPIETVLFEKKDVTFYRDVRNTYPDDPLLNEWLIQGYAATPLITSNGEVVGVLAVLRRAELDETEMVQSVLKILGNRAAVEIERRRYEQKLITERNRANEMNMLKNHFLSNMSHEVRTPLNSIIGFTSLLREGLKEKEELEFLSYIEEGGNRLLQTINDLLDLSVLESEQENVKSQKIDLETEVSEAIGMMSNQADDKNIVLDYTMKVPKVIVLADPRMLGQVIRKLIENAIKFTEKGSARITVDIAEKNHRKVGMIQISDTGIGIDEKFLPYVFDDFKQESQGLSRKYEGVGLGLTIAKKMTTLMDGIIEVESEKNKGSVFSVYLPLGE